MSTVAAVLETAVDRKERAVEAVRAVCHKALTCIGHRTVAVAVENHRTADAVGLTETDCLFHSNHDLVVVDLVCSRDLVVADLVCSRDLVVADLVCSRDNRMHTAEALVFRTLVQNGQTCRHTFQAVGVHLVVRFVCRRKDFFLVMSVFGKLAVVDSLVDMGTDRRIPTPASGSWWVGEA